MSSYVQWSHVVQVSEKSATGFSCCDSTYCCNCSSQVGITFVVSVRSHDIVCDDLREGGTISNVASTSRWVVNADLMNNPLSSNESMPCVSNAIILRDFPSPIVSASMPPLKELGKLVCISPVTLLRYLFSYCQPDPVVRATFLTKDMCRVWTLSIRYQLHLQNPTPSPAWP